MSFPRNEEEGYLDKQADSEWTLDHNKWAQRRRIMSKVYETDNDWAQIRSYAWHGIEEAGDIITMRAAFGIRDAAADVGFIARDYATGTIPFSSTLVPQAYAVITWGSGGAHIGDWNGVKAITGPGGIPLNYVAANRHIKHGNWAFLESQLIAVGQETAMNWQLQYQSDNDSEVIVYGVARIKKDLRQFRRVGITSTQNMEVLGLHVFYY